MVRFKICDVHDCDKLAYRGVFTKSGNLKAKYCSKHSNQMCKRMCLKRFGNYTRKLKDYEVSNKDPLDEIFIGKKGSHNYP